MKSKRRSLIKYGILPPEVIKDFAHIRARIQKAVDSCSKTVTIHEAIEQIKKFNETKTD